MSDLPPQPPPPPGWGAPPPPPQQPGWGAPPPPPQQPGWGPPPGQPWGAPPPPKKRSKAPFIAGGVILGLLVLVVVGAVVVFGGTTAFDLEAGDCFDKPEDTTAIGSVDTIDCDKAHDNEVYLVEDLPNGNGEDFPGAAGVNEGARERCLEEFEGFIGEPYETSRFDIFTITPSEETWNDGDREFVCAVFDINGEQTTGTAEGIGE